MKDLYILSTRAPYPIRKGDQVTLDAKIRILSKYFNIFLITPKNAYFPYEHYLNCKIKFKFYKKRWVDLFLGLIYCFKKKYPLHFSLFYSKEGEKIVEKIIKKNSNFFHLHLARSIILCGNKLPENLSIDFIDSMQLALKNRTSNFFLTNLFFFFESKFAAKVENFLAKKSYYASAVSKRDALSISKKVMIVPNGVYKTKIKNYENSKYLKIVVSGNFSYPPNKECFSKLVKLVEHSNYKESLKVYAVGKNSNLLKIKNKKLNYVKLVGEVDSLVKEISKYDISAAIMDLGTGIQNKCLEAMSVGLPIIASKQVIDGLIKPIPLGFFNRKSSGF